MVSVSLDEGRGGRGGSLATELDRMDGAASALLAWAIVVVGAWRTLSYRHAGRMEYR